MRFRDSTMLVLRGIQLAVHTVAWGVVSCLPPRFHHLVTIALISGVVVSATPMRVGAQSLHYWVADMLEGIREGMAEDGRILAHAPLTGTLEAGGSASVQVHTCAGIEYTARA